MTGFHGVPVLLFLSLTGLECQPLSTYSPCFSHHCSPPNFPPFHLWILPSDIRLFFFFFSLKGPSLKFVGVPFSSLRWSRFWGKFVSVFLCLIDIISFFFFLFFATFFMGPLLLMMMIFFIWLNSFTVNCSRTRSVYCNFLEQEREICSVHCPGDLIPFSNLQLIFAGPSLLSLQ